MATTVTLGKEAWIAKAPLGRSVRRIGPNVRKWRMRDIRAGGCRWRYVAANCPSRPAWLVVAALSASVVRDLNPAGPVVELHAAPDAWDRLPESKPGKMLCAGGIAHDHPGRRAEFVMMPELNQPTPDTLLAELLHVVSGFQAALMQGTDDVATKLKGSKSGLQMAMKPVSCALARR